jgi:hypothetical protein
MATQAVTISSTADASGAFTVSGVFWCIAPANNIVPLPAFRSAVPSVTASDLAALRSGSVVEVPFQAPSGFGASGARSYPSGTTQASVDSDIQTMLTAAQAAVTAGNPGLSTAINRAYNGSSWAAYGGTLGALPLGTPPQIVTDFYIAIAQGLLPNVIAGRAFGYVSTSAASGVRILATAYSPAAPGAAAQRSVSSSSSSDASAGTGARTVTITYLTTAFLVKQETVTLNGTTAVNTVGTDIAYIESIAVATCGSGLTNAGTISLFNATAGGGGTLGSIAAGDGQTNWAHHYVPAGKTCLVTSVSFGCTITAGRGFANRTGDPSQSTLPILPIGGQYAHLAGGNEDHMFQVPVVVPGPDRIFLTEFPNASTASTAFGAFEYIQL